MSLCIFYRGFDIATVVSMRSSIRINSDIVKSHRIYDINVKPVKDTCSLRLIFDYLVKPSKCGSKFNQKLIDWKINDLPFMEFHILIQNGAVSFAWKGPANIFGGLLEPGTVTRLDQAEVRYLPLKAKWNNLNFEVKESHLRINSVEESTLNVELLNDRLKNLLKRTSKHTFEVFGSHEIKLDNLRIESAKKTQVRKNSNANGAFACRKARNRNIPKSDPKNAKFCQVELDAGKQCSKENCNHEKINKKIYLTPEIYYTVKTCSIQDQNENKNNKDIKNNREKNNIANSYNSNMSGRFCITNPLTSFKGFTMDFIVKNLILFGILFLFITYLANPAIETNQRLIVCGVVLLIYNLLHIIFVILENIFVWACQYSNVSDLVGEEL